MPLSCKCLGKFSFCCPCKLNVLGYASGCLGIIWRLILLVFISTSLSKVTSYDPNIYSIFLSTFLAYISVSFVINCIFIYGICKKRMYFLIPYVTIVALEMVIGVMVLSGIIMILFSIGAIAMAIYFIIIAILIIGIHFTLWLYNILLYKEFQHESLFRNQNGSPIQITEMAS
ncbi:uncharacterized protein [Euwallacea fornicatus]|uniref:uncharacterized protein n=1 Tax=Euwallacea fornicatus TaxID=995702 RepID=UPI00338D56D7